MGAGARFFTFAAAGLACGALASPAMAATTYYASPTGSGSSCTQASPCPVNTAATKATDGDTVVVAPGTYTLTSAIGLSKAVDLGGQPGAAAPIIQTTAANDIYDIEGAGATFHDLKITGGGGIVLNSGLGERLYVDYSGTHSSGCSIEAGATMRDSVCWTHSSSPSIAALDVGAISRKGTATLRNDTFESTGLDGLGIFAIATNSGADLTVDAANVIVHATSVDVESSTQGSGSPVTAVDLAHSSYVTTQVEPSTSITPAGTNGNITAAPSFVEAGSGNFAEAAGSPTIDAGLTDSLIGATDLLGNPRSLPACIGGTPVPDIGAYEFVPTVACPAPPAPSNVIKLGKLTKNAKKGTATLQVTVPGAGQLVLSGKGLKKVARGAKGAGTLKLPITPVGSAKKKLASTGSAKLKLSVRFTPTGGTAATRTKSVKLVRSPRR